MSVIGKKSPRQYTRGSRVLERRSNYKGSAPCPACFPMKSVFIQRKACGLDFSRHLSRSNAGHSLDTSAASAFGFASCTTGASLIEDKLQPRPKH